MFSTPDRSQIQALDPQDTRVTCLEDEISVLMDSLISLDIALRNRDYVSQRVSEDVAHALIRQAGDLLSLIAHPRGG